MYPLLFRHRSVPDFYLFSQRNGIFAAFQDAQAAKCEIIRHLRKKNNVKNSGTTFWCDG